MTNSITSFFKEFASVKSKWLNDRDHSDKLSSFLHRHCAYKEYAMIPPFLMNNNEFICIPVDCFTNQWKYNDQVMEFQIFNIETNTWTEFHIPIECKGEEIEDEQQELEAIWEVQFGGFDHDSQILHLIAENVYIFKIDLFSNPDKLIVQRTKWPYYIYFQPLSIQKCSIYYNEACIQCIGYSIDYSAIICYNFTKKQAGNKYLYIYLFIHYKQNNFVLTLI